MKSIQFPDDGSDSQLADSSLSAEEDGLGENTDQSSENLSKIADDNQARGKKLEP